MLAEVSPSLAHTGPDSNKFDEVAPIWPEFGPRRPGFGQIWASSTKFGLILAQIGPEAIKLERFRPKLARRVGPSRIGFDQCWARYRRMLGILSRPQILVDTRSTQP